MSTSEAAALFESSALELNAIAERHYGRSLADILGDVNDPLSKRQFARLLGVVVKLPFAMQIERPPSKSTNAKIALKWMDDATIRPTASETWQFKFIQALISDERGQPISEDKAFAELTHFQYESSLGKFLFQAFRNRICGDQQISKSMREAIEQAKKAGVRVAAPNVAGLSVGAASTISVAIATHLNPAIAAVGAPVIGVLALLILQIGVDGFCLWSRSVIEETQAIEHEQ
jgi:hypothetical protein